MRIKPLSIVLWALSFASLFLAFRTSNDPVPVQPVFSSFPAANPIIFDLSTGFLVSVMLYWLVVWFPDRQRKRLLKRNFQEYYRLFKEDSIGIFLGGCGISYEADLPTKLSDPREFRKYFKEAVSDGQNRWDCFLNGLYKNDRPLKDLLVEMEILMNEVAFVLNNVRIDDRDVFAFFKRLSQAVYRLKNSTPEYDEVKPLSRFVWELFAGWSFIEGSRDTDIVEVMIRKI